MKMATTLRALISEVWEHLEALQKPVHLPGLWIMGVHSMEECLEIEESMAQEWDLFTKQIKKLLKIWLRRLKKWDVHSLTTFLEKTSTTPGDILATSFSLTTYNFVTSSLKNSIITDDPDEKECLDTQSNLITSMSSTTAPTEEPIVETSSGGKFSLTAHLDQLGQRTNPSASSGEPTGTMCSSISFLRKGVPEKYSLEEKVGKNRLTVIYNNFHYTQIICISEMV